MVETSRREFLKKASGLVLALNSPVALASAFATSYETSTPEDIHLPSSSTLGSALATSYKTSTPEDIHLASSSTLGSIPETFKKLTSREDLYNIPEEELLARMIFGEADSCPSHEQIAIAYTATNRLNDNKSYNGRGSLTRVLLKKYNGNDQYDCFKDTSKSSRLTSNFHRTLNPEEHDIKTWEHCLEIANQIMENKHPNLNKGQTSYVTNSQIKEWKEKGITDNWFHNSIPITIPSPDASKFKHQFVRDP